MSREIPGRIPARKFELHVQICLRGQNIVWGRVNISICSGSFERDFQDFHGEQIELSALYIDGCLVIPAVSSEGSRYRDCVGGSDVVPAVLFKERLQGSARLHSAQYELGG